MKVSPHSHVESLLTGSTIKNMVTLAKQSGRTHFAYTDCGHLSSTLKVYSACQSDAKEAKKTGKAYLANKLQFIPGIEVYFKDSNCPATTGTSAARAKYFTVTIYCRDQASYQELSRYVSRTDFPTIELREQNEQLWSWADLEHMAKFNTSIVLGGIHCMVGKCLLADAPEAGMKVYQRLVDIFTSERIAASILCEPWTKQYSTVVEIFYGDGTKDAILASDTVTTDKARKIKAIDLAERGGHYRMYSLTKANTYYEINKAIDNVKVHKGFLPLPGGDASLKVNKFLSALSNRFNVRLLATDYAFYANKEDKIVQTMRLEGNSKLQPNLHMKTEQEIVDYLELTLKLTSIQSATIINNNSEWAKQFDGFTLKYDWRLAEVGEQSAIQKIMDIVKSNGRMKWDDQKYVSRLKEEIDVIHRNGVFDLSPYFLPIRDVLNFYLEKGELTGPGRGSAGGSLLCYLMGITQINPFKYDLPFQRFFSMVRIKGKKLPDIDVDLEDRTLLVGEDGHSGYLYGRWGDKAAQISTRTTMRLKSAIKGTNRYFKGKIEEEIETLTSGLPAPPQGVSDNNFVFGFEDDEGNHIDGILETSPELQAYAEKRPEEWSIVSKAMGLTTAFSKHASAFVISDVPIKDVVPTKEGNITQYEAKEVEAAGLIKYDFLVIKQLKDIRVCLNLINKKNNEDHVVGYFSHNKEKMYIWDLPEMKDVYHSIWSGQTETLFQINTKPMLPYVLDMLPENIMDIATLLALVRPGPLDFIDPATGRNMAQEYMLRRKGQSEPDIKEMQDLLPDTFGILAFQEDLNKIARGLAGMDAETAELLRENMAKKKMEELMKMKPLFIEGAIKKVSEEIAEKIWEQMVTFGRYGFSIIHAVEYAHITYACMFLKHYYKLEWWGAVLTNAKETEITGKFWPYVKDMVAAPDINLSSDVMVVDYANEKLRAKFGVLRGMGEKTINPLVESRPYSNIQDFVNKGVAGSSLSHKLIHVGVLDSLFPPKTTLIEKLQAFENASEVKLFEDKKQKSMELGKKMRNTQPRPGKVPVEYTDLHPMKDAAMKKAVLPSMSISTYYLGSHFSKVLAPYVDKPMVLSAKGYETILLNGEQLERLDQVEGSLITEDIYVAATCFIVEAKEFSYSKNTKRALKMIIDVDGYVSEKVLWPEYESGQLVYPASLKKGAIATFFLRKRIGKKDMAIMSITVETEENK